MPTEFSRQAQSILRDPEQFQWYIIPLLAIVLYIYSVEISKKNWNVIFAGLALMGMDWLNEIVNSFIFYFTQHAPLWGAPGDTAFLILIGLNIEIQFLFAIAGIFTAKILPEDPKLKILGIPNRWFFGFTWSVFAVFIEVLLNLADALTWEWPFWNAKFPFLIVVFGYWTFLIVAFYVHDLKSMKKKILITGSL
ncbi:MAG: hypothetical protein OEZ34_16270, partial [Spirochaetia bacterium]|nr:hypothetical protein [Spirochaetia bacterium]